MMNLKRFVSFGAGAMAAILLLLVGACEQRGAPQADQGGDNPDVVVIGSEIEGVYLARAARDEGLSVTILDPREKPGGQLIQGEMLYLDEPFGDNNESLLQGKVKLLFDRYKKGEIRKREEFETYYASLLNGIRLESGITLAGVEIEPEKGAVGRAIRSLTYTTKSGETKTLSAKYWVENSDMAALSSRLGLSRIPGIETVFGGERDHMAASLMMKFRQVDWARFQQEIGRLTRQEREEKYGKNTTVTDKFTWGFSGVGGRYKPSSKEMFLRGLNTIHQRDGEVLVNALLLYGVDPADPDSVTRARELGMRETERILPHLRQELPGWENAEINGYPDYLYIRDYDRYETEYVLQAADLMSGRMFEDNVSIAGYPIDLQGTRNNNWGTSKGDPDKYGMPLRAFLAKGYTNVIMAGKNVGASAIAYGSARIQPNTSLAGEVIGVLLARWDGKGSLAELSPKDMKDLQAYVKKKYNITLTGVKSANKIAGLTEEEIRRLNAGK
ncbi:FAD-dependent oxidoreductase [Paenibacillus puerhi]|uniref:FAD-dependent oxidoreductase n=1 Tax=Paenibacillus puerhi TaxID=2692622 RepID=UPI00135B16C1|nr:FAD-dependent oxidoreductase [Paenibacillus puerhi]